jgi:16S rRNA (uracil1498-N3)-methyltransferase
MQLYYDAQLKSDSKQIVLDTITSKHLIQVLRMKVNEEILLTNGNGLSAKGSIIDANKWNCKVSISDIKTHIYKKPKLAMAVSFTKNKSRNEWMLEKLMEIGVTDIIPLQTARTEKEKINLERVNSILVAGLIQSKQYFLPYFHDATQIKDLKVDNFPLRYVAHCEDDSQKNYLMLNLKEKANTIICIGPEGDFTHDEIILLKEKGFRPISLGINRLRTETAAIYAATIFNAYVDSK